MYLRDPHFVAGFGPPALAAVGVSISAYSPTRIVFTLGSCYGHNGWTIAPGDGYTMDVLGTSFSGTAFPPTPTSTTYTLPDGVAPFSSSVYDDWTILGNVGVTNALGAAVTQGTVTLTVDGSQQCQGAPSLPCPLQLSAGFHQVGVSYSGSSGLSGSSATYAVDVLPIPTTTTVAQDTWWNLFTGSNASWQATVSASPVAPGDSYEIMTVVPALSSQSDNIVYQCSWNELDGYVSPQLATGLQAGSNDTLVSSEIYSNPYCSIAGIEDGGSVAVSFDYPGDSIYGASIGLARWAP